MLRPRCLGRKTFNCIPKLWIIQTKGNIRKMERQQCFNICVLPPGPLFMSLPLVSALHLVLGFCWAVQVMKHMGNSIGRRKTKVICHIVSWYQRKEWSPSVPFLCLCVSLDTLRIWWNRHPKIQGLPQFSGSSAPNLPQLTAETSTWLK